MSRWLEPPMKLVDAVNVLYDALAERWLVFGKDYPSLHNGLSYPSRRSNAIKNAHKNIIYEIEDLLSRGVIIAPSSVGTWCTPYPYKGWDAESHIKDILTKEGIDPSFFYLSENPPKKVAEKKFFEAAYLLINKYLRYICAPFAICMSTKEQWSNTEWRDGESVSTSGIDVRERATQRRIVLNSSGTGMGGRYVSRRNLIDSTAQCEYNYNTSQHLVGDWKFRKHGISLYGALDSYGVSLIATYTQDISMRGDTFIPFPTMAGDFVSINDYMDADNSTLYEDFSYDGNTYSIFMENDQILLTENNFPNTFKYYDPPE